MDTHCVDMLCTGTSGEHAQDASSAADIQDDFPPKEVLVVVHCIAIGERPHLVLQHLLVDA